MLDMHVHLLGHLDRQATEEHIRAFLDQAIRMKLQGVGFADHEEYREHMDLPLIRRVAKSYPQLNVYVGVEVEYRPGEDRRIEKLLKSFDFDYSIGSVHEINGWLFDYENEAPRHRQKDPDEMYRQYFDLIGQAADSGYFSILGHIDLIKIFGLRPKKPLLGLAETMLEKIAAAGVAVELNTNGRYKPVGEWYPSPPLLAELVKRGIPLSLGSDAHEWANVGRDFLEARYSFGVVPVCFLNSL